MTTIQINEKTKTGKNIFKNAQLYQWHTSCTYLLITILICY